MSYSSKVVYTGDAVTTDFTVSFPYISTSHVSVYVNEILQLSGMNYNWSGASTISFVDAPQIDDAIRIQRWTSPAATLVDFVDGSTLRADDLDTAYLHNYYLSQEYADSFNDLINTALLNVATGAGIVETETDAVIAALVNEMISEAAAANLQARISDIDANAEAIITLGEGLQTQINTLAEGVAAAVYVQATEPVPGVGGIPDPIPEGARWYDTSNNNAPYIYQSSAWVSITDPRIGVAAADIDVLQVNTANTNAALVDEMFVRATETTALSSRLDLLGAASGDNTAFILDLDKVYASDAESLSSRFSTITADWTSADATTLSSANGYTDGEAATLSASITAESVARASADGALASTIALLGAENGTSTAFILDTSTVKIDSDGGDTFATRLTGLAAADSANSASITTIQTVTIPGVETDVTAVEGRATDLESFQATAEAEYGVTLDVNGNIAGFKLIANGAGSSSFVVAAEKFAIADPGNPDLQPFTVSGSKIVMNGDVSINGSLLLNGTIVGSALVAGTIGSTQIGANAITTTQLNASAVSAAKIAANAVTADKINVTSLAAVSADLGTITAGTITLNGAGHIKGGQTAYNTGTGYFLGYEGSNYHFSIGNPSGNRITWDGDTSLLTIVGDVKVGEYIVDATETVATANTERSVTGLSNTSYTMKKSFSMDRDGDVRLYFDYKGSGVSYASGYIRWKKNGVVVASQTVSNTVYANRTYDWNGLSEGDLLTVELAPGQWWSDAKEPGTTYIKNCQLRAVVTIPGSATVNTN